MTTRTRTKSDSSGPCTTSYSYTMIGIRDSDGAILAQGFDGPHTDSWLTVVEESSMTDTVTKGFKKLSSEGKIILSPMSSSKVTTVNVISPISGTVSRRVGTTSSTRGWYNYTYSGTIGTSALDLTNFPTVALASAEAIAVSEAHANISLSEMQLFASLGEARETLETVRSLFLGVKALLKKDLTYIKKLKKPSEVANAYLALRYGIRPLYYDIQGALAVLQAKPPTDQRQTFRGYHSDHGESTSYSDKLLFDVLVRTKKTTEVNVRSRAGVLTDINFQGLTSLLGLYEIPQSAWELVPFSFIIDWFLNVGKVIASWSPKPEFKVLGSWVTTEVETKHKASVDSLKTSSSCGTTNPKGCIKLNGLAFSPYYEKTIITKTRTINPSIPILPHFDVKLDYLKLLDIALIMKSLLKKT